MKSTYLILFLLLFFSCSKFEWVNPYDSASDKSLFTPSDPGAVMEGNAVKVTWSQSNDKISGFALYRSVEGEPITSLAQVQKTTLQYVDASVTAGKRYTYYIVAVAGSNNSDTVKYSIVPVFPVSVSTVAVSDVSIDSARVSGNLTSAGGGTVLSRGICWSTSTGPTLSNSKTIEGTSVGEFSSVLKGLQSGIKYYARAYGENSRGVSYGSELSFTTFGIPQLYTYDADSIGSTYARIGGNITSDGGSPVTERGVCWSTSDNPTVLNSKTIDGSGTGNYISRMKELSPSTRYYVRAYATNKFGTAYGPVSSFTTTQPTVLITTSAITNITSSGATGGGNITSDGGSVITARGVCWSTSQNPTIANAKTVDGSGTGTFTSNITGLSASTTYYVRSYATNQYGTTYGQQQTFNSLDFAFDPISLSQGLVAYYSFNGNTNDETQSQNAATASSVTYGPDYKNIPDKAIEIPFGTSGYLKTNGVLQNVQNSFTISFWAKPLSETNQPKNEGVSGKEGSSSHAVIHPTHGREWGDEKQHTGVGVFVSASQVQVVEHTVGYVGSPLVFSGYLTGWHHYVVVYENKKPSLYIDGQFKKTGLMSIYPFVHPSNGYDSMYYLSGFGRSFAPGGTVGQFNGSFDEIRIYDRVLLQSEISYLANN